MTEPFHRQSGNRNPRPASQWPLRDLTTLAGLYQQQCQPGSACTARCKPKPLNGLCGTEELAANVCHTARVRPARTMQNASAGYEEDGCLLPNQRDPSVRGHAVVVRDDESVSRVDG